MPKKSNAKLRYNNEISHKGKVDQTEYQSSVQSRKQKRAEAKANKKAIVKAEQQAEEEMLDTELDDSGISVDPSPTLSSNETGASDELTNLMGEPGVWHFTAAYGSS